MNHTASVNYLDTEKAWMKTANMQLYSFTNQFHEFSSLEFSKGQSWKQAFSWECAVWEAQACSVNLFCTPLLRLSMFSSGPRQIRACIRNRYWILSNAFSACIEIIIWFFILVCLQMSYMDCWASLIARTVKNLPAMQETWVWSLGQEDPLKRMATHSNIRPLRIPRRGAWWATVHGVAKSQTWLSD